MKEIDARSKLLISLRRIVSQVRALRKAWHRDIGAVLSNGVRVVKFDVSGLTVEEIAVLMADGKSNYRLEYQGGKVYAVKDDAE